LLRVPRVRVVRGFPNHSCHARGVVAKSAWMQNSTRQAARGTPHSGPPMAPRTMAAFLVAVAAVVIIAVLSYASLQAAANSARSLTKTIEVLAQLQTVLSTLKDAETGQRGYLLTGRESYLEPFSGAKSALASEFAALRLLTGDNPAQHKRLEALQVLASDKMTELGETVALRRAGQTEQALAIVLTDRGKNQMDSIRSVVDEMTGSERQLISVRTTQWQSAATVSFWVTWGGSAVLLFLIAAAATLASRDFRARQL
jgi:CHASE3 domain sensor protein